jgi:1-phosphofructokinase family hexose kinase
VILTVTPNPALDVTYRVPGLTPGETMRVDPPASRAGGKGVNVARVARQAGYESRAVLTAGGRRGAELEQDLAAGGIPCTIVPVDGETRSTTTLADPVADTATVLAESGSALSAAECDRLRLAVRRDLAGAACLTVSGSLPPGMDPALPAELVGDARRAGVPAIADVVGRALQLACEAGADAVKPNRRELAETTGLADPLAGAARLLDLGAGVVFVSLGPEGLLAVSRERRLHARLPAPVRGNPTGAGDAVVAAIATAWSDGVHELPELLRRATAWSAAAVLSPLAGELDPAFRDVEPGVLVRDA